MRVEGREERDTKKEKRLCSWSVDVHDDTSDIVSFKKKHFQNLPGDPRIFSIDSIQKMGIPKFSKFFNSLTNS